MSTMPYYKAYPDDFFRGTLGLSFELKGAYRLILDMIYMQDGQLPDDARYISGLLNCSVRKWNAIRSELLTLGKIQIIDGFISNYRAIIEVENYRKLRDKNAENGARSNKNNRLIQATAQQARDKPEPEPELSSLRSDRGDACASSPPDDQIKKKLSAKKTKGSRLPDDWSPSEEDIAFARQQGLSDQQIETEGIRFRNYWTEKTGQGATKIAWRRTWQNWILKDFGNGTQQRTHSKSADKRSAWKAAGLEAALEFTGHSNRGAHRFAGEAGDDGRFEHAGQFSGMRKTA